MEKKTYNLILCRHHENDIARVFQLPDEVDVEPFQILLCDTARGSDQVVTAMAANIRVDEEDLDTYLKWQGTNRDKLRPITGKVVTKAFGENENKRQEPEAEEDEGGVSVEVHVIAIPCDEDEGEDEDEKKCSEHSPEEWVDLLLEGAIAAAATAKHLDEKEVGPEHEAIIPLLANAVEAVTTVCAYTLAAAKVVDDISGKAEKKEDK